MLDHRLGALHRLTVLRPLSGRACGLEGRSRQPAARAAPMHGIGPNHDSLGIPDLLPHSLIRHRIPFPHD